MSIKRKLVFLRKQKKRLMRREESVCVECSDGRIIVIFCICRTAYESHAYASNVYHNDIKNVYKEFL